MSLTEEQEQFYRQTLEISRKQIETLRANCAEFGVTLYDIGDVRQGIVQDLGAGDAQRAADGPGVVAAVVEPRKADGLVHKPGRALCAAAGMRRARSIGVERWPSGPDRDLSSHEA